MTTTIPAGWLPIESAPKDGQSILGRGPRQDTVVIAWDEWAQPEARWKAVHLDVNGYECPEIVLRGEPTLWQPMPAPPCPTCNDQGAVGNILTAQPCPDCAAPGVSTVEDHPAAWMEPGIDVPVTNEYRNKTPLRQAKYCVPLYKHAPIHAPAAGDAVDWYERRLELEPEMIFRTASGVVRLDRAVPGDGTKWFVLDWNGDGWSAYDSTVEPGDLIGVPVADHPIAIELARAAIAAQRKGDA
ncbi:hypothetical protein ACOTHJ_32805 [Achromobacter xylosoxidans]